MDVSSYLSQFDERRVVHLSAEEHSSLLESGEILREEDTHLAGFIRLLSVQDQFVVQEEHPDRDGVLTRRFGSRADADRFIQERLDTYERMWDGCGCKVNYFE